MSQKKKTTHVVKHKSGWAVRNQGSARATKVYKTQRDAITAAKRMASSNPVVIHRKDGSIREWIKKVG